MTEVATQVAPQAQRPSLVAKIAGKYGVDPAKLMQTLKATAFKSTTPVTDEQMLALLVVADQYDLNPFLKQIYAFPDKGGITPVVGFDGWVKIANAHPMYDGVEFDYDVEEESVRCSLFRKDREHRISVTEFMSECRRDTGPWKSHPKRMLRHKAFIQACRLAFGFANIFDPDEGEAIRRGAQVIDGEVIDAKPTGIAAVRAAATAKRAAPAQVDPHTGEIVGSATELDDEALSLSVVSERIQNAADVETAGLALDGARGAVSDETFEKLVAVWRSKWEKV